MIGAAIGAAAGLAGSVIGGIQAKKAARKAQAALDKKAADNESLWRQKRNEDYTQSAEAQAALTRGREAMMHGLNHAAGTQAVMGGSEAASASSKEAANNAMADATANIAAQATARKDAAESRYLGQKDTIDNARISVYNQQAANSTQAANQSMQAGLGLAVADAQAHLDNGKGLFESMFKK